MIRQHKKNDITHIDCDAAPDPYRIAFVEAASGFRCNPLEHSNEPDGYSSKAFAVFGLPVIMLILHLVCVIATNIDPKANSINKKIFFIVLWICPVFSIIICSTVYGYNLGYQFDIGFLCGCSSEFYT